MTRIAPIRTPTPAHRVPSTRKANPLQRIKDIAKSVPWLAAPPLFVLSIVVMAVGKVHEHGALMLLLPGGLLGLVLLYQLQRLTWKGDCQPDQPLGIAPAIVLGLVFAVLDGIWHYQLLSAAQQILKILMVVRLPDALLPIAWWAGFLQGALVFIWLGLRMNRSQYFVIVLGFHLAAFLLLAVCWPLAELAFSYPYYFETEALAMIGILAAGTVLWLVLWGIAPVMFLRLQRLTLRRKRMEDVSLEED